MVLYIPSKLIRTKGKEKKGTVKDIISNMRISQLISLLFLFHEEIERPGPSFVVGIRKVGGVTWWAAQVGGHQFPLQIVTLNHHW